MSPVALTIAGFDPTGGAGVTLDARIFSQSGIYPVSVITGVVSQNTEGVERVFFFSKDMVKSQLSTLLSDIIPDGVKLGMLANKDVSMIIWGEIRKLDIPVVVDPVWRASSEDTLFEGDYRTIYRDFILPLATVVLPNVPEAEELSGVTIEKEDDMVSAAEKILETGVKAVLIKGGHLEGRKVDLYYDSSHTEFLEVPEDSFEIHGTGCTLAALVLKHILLGDTIFDAVKRAREDFFEERKRAFRPGQGGYLFPWVRGG